MYPAHLLVLPSFYSDPEKPLRGSFFREQAEEMARAGIRVGVAFVEPRSLRAFCPAAIRTSHFQRSARLEGSILTLRQHGWNPGMRTKLGGRLWGIFTQRLVDYYIRAQGRPDLIHVQSALWAGTAALDIRQRLGIPYVVTEHSSLLLDETAVTGYHEELSSVYRGASAVSAVSRVLGRRVQNYLGGQAVTITPNFAADTIKEPTLVERPEHNYTFLFVGNLIRTKGVHVLLDSFSVLHRSDPEVRLRVIGGGPELPRLRRQAEALGVCTCVEFTGELPRAAISGEMAAADAFVLPSFVETFSVVLIEALASGLPVVVTRCGGPEEIIEQVTGILVRVNDSTDLLRGMTEVRQAPSMGRNELRSRTLACYSAAAYRQRLLAFYNGVHLAGAGKISKANLPSV